MFLRGWVYYQTVRQWSRRYGDAGPLRHWRQLPGCKKQLQVSEVKTFFFPTDPGQQTPSFSRSKCF